MSTGSNQLGLYLTLFAALGLAGCEGPLNSPYPAADAERNILYSSFSERPKHLDPARAYSSDESLILGQIYEPLLQYHYLKRPYVLEPATAEALPEIRYLDAGGRVLPPGMPDSAIAYSEYDFRLKRGIRFQPHPAFARGVGGEYLYHHLGPEQLARIQTLADFSETGTRELTAEDYAYQIKRLLHPALHSPIAELMKEHIVGFKALGDTLERDYFAAPKGQFFDLRRYALEGVQVPDPHRLVIRLNGKYPQFRFWLAMSFFAPMPWEADAFYAQPGLIEKNITLDWYPVGSGPYMLAENNPNRRMVLERNPYFHEDRYPAEGDPEDAPAGLLADAGRLLPLVDRVVMVLEKETIPYWNKFLQGYYDYSGIASDNFDQAVQVGSSGSPELTPEMLEKGIRLETSVAASDYYLGFNLRDPVVGGLDEAHCKLRQALSIAMDYEEFIAIFMNGRGVPAQGVLPPGIYGYREGEKGINPYVYDWVDGAPRRKSIETARRLLAEAGYPNGVDAVTGKPLVLYLDLSTHGADDKPLLAWYRKQLEKLGVQLVFRATDYNQFQQKMAAGNAQIYQWGWNADYPDPENFFFLLYGRNAKVPNGGENTSNYVSEEFDRLFERMRNLDDGPERLAVIDALQEKVRHDAPWIFGLHPKGFSLHHAWYGNLKPNLMANNKLKYLKIDARQRAARRAEWNRPVWWPLLAGLALLLAAVVPAYRSYRHRLRAAAL
ncbi:ABC transporter substrate-binding protein [Methylococcus capsulatus]|uniref:ABC transporter substrate-binding protein n=1 Tax=Methylococcus capsulatus TaxID=414 RepID=UPI001C52EF61|nr:ABC transporter substrate-binding protein [Methylococcus capsulatus]QXP90632.1 ABC transporter substrate-binding protein [Methylococcus capsulatus]